MGVQRKSGQESRPMCQIVETQPKNLFDNFGKLDHYTEKTEMEVLKETYPGSDT